MTGSEDFLHFKDNQCIRVAHFPPFWVKNIAGFPFFFPWMHTCLSLLYKSPRKTSAWHCPFKKYTYALTISHSESGFLPRLVIRTIHRKCDVLTEAKHFHMTFDFYIYNKYHHEHL